TLTFGANIGDLLTFTLTNTDTGSSFSTGVGSTNVAYLSTNNAATVESQLGINLSATAEAALAALVGPVVVVAFEDLVPPNPDQDFNALISAFPPVSGGTGGPEPMSLALIGAGLLGVGYWSRRRRAA